MDLVRKSVLNFLVFNINIIIDIYQIIVDNYLRVMAAAHWSLRMSRQMAPVTELMFGCHILVMKRTLNEMRMKLIRN